MSSSCSCAILWISTSLFLLLAACNVTLLQEEGAGSAQVSGEPIPLPEPDDARQPAKDASTSTSSVPATRAGPHSSQRNASTLCNATRAQQVVGKVATQDVIDRVAADSTSTIVRVIRPGDAITDDYNEGRLNLEVDTTNSIIRAKCG